MEKKDDWFRDGVVGIFCCVGSSFCFGYYLYVYQYKGRGDTANKDRSDFRYFRAKNASCSVS